MRLADQYGPENLAVVLGNGEANGVEVFAETVTQGDPSYAGPLAGVARTLLNLEGFITRE